MQKLLLITYFLFFFTFLTNSQTVFINEIKYLAEDPLEKGIELANLNDTDLAGWTITLYNSSGVPYGTVPLVGASANFQEAEDANIIIFVDIMMLSINDGSGVVLTDANDNVVQYLSYCGTQTGNEGPATGMVSTDIGCQEGDNTPQLTGEGYELNTFQWNVNTSSSGEINVGQAFSSAPDAGGLLPVEWVDFSATPQKTGILLEWTTGTEHDNNHFVLERSSDGRTFEIVEHIQSQGTSMKAQYYEFLDTKASRGTNYYRISQMDASNEMDAYKVIEARFESNEILHIYPNPAINDIVINLPIIDELISIEIFDQLGKLVVHKTTTAGNGLLNLQVTELLTGHYVLVVKTDEQMFSQKLIKK